MELGFHCGYVFRPLASSVRHAVHTVKHIRHVVGPHLHQHHLGRIAHHVPEHKAAAVFVCSVVAATGFGVPFGSPFAPGGIFGPALVAGSAGPGSGGGAFAGGGGSTESGIFEITPGGFVVTTHTSPELTPELAPETLVVLPLLPVNSPELVSLQLPTVPATSPTPPNQPVPE